MSWFRDEEKERAKLDKKLQYQQELKAQMKANEEAKRLQKLADRSTAYVHPSALGVKPYARVSDNSINVLHSQMQHQQPAAGMRSGVADRHRSPIGYDDDMPAAGGRRNGRDRDRDRERDRDRDRDWDRDDRDYGRGRDFGRDFDRGFNGGMGGMGFGMDMLFGPRRGGFQDDDEWDRDRDRYRDRDREYDRDHGRDRDRDRDRDRAAAPSQPPPSTFDPYRSPSNAIGVGASLSPPKPPTRFMHSADHNQSQQAKLDKKLQYQEELKAQIRAKEEAKRLEKLADRAGVAPSVYAARQQQQQQQQLHSPSQAPRNAYAPSDNGYGYGRPAPPDGDMDGYGHGQRLHDHDRDYGRNPLDAALDMFRSPHPPPPAPLPSLMPGGDIGGYGGYGHGAASGYNDSVSPYAAPRRAGYDEPSPQSRQVGGYGAPPPGAVGAAPGLGSPSRPPPGAGLAVGAGAGAGPRSQAYRSDLYGGSDQRNPADEAARKAEYARELQRQMEDNIRKKAAEAEKKRLLDEKEYREMQNYNPFGKAGAGAPVRDETGAIVANRRQAAQILGASPTRQHQHQQQQQQQPPPGPMTMDPYGGRPGVGSHAGGFGSAPAGLGAAAAGGTFGVDSHDHRHGRGKVGLQSPDAATSLANKRSAMEEYQRMLEQQVEEKKRRQAEEKARLKAEEEAEESRFQKQRQEQEEQMAREKAANRQAAQEAEAAANAAAQSKAAARKRHVIDMDPIPAPADHFSPNKSTHSLHRDDPDDRPLHGSSSKGGGGGGGGPRMIRDRSRSSFGNTSDLYDESGEGFDADRSPARRRRRGGGGAGAGSRRHRPSTVDESLDDDELSSILATQNESIGKVVRAATDESKDLLVPTNGGRRMMRSERDLMGATGLPPALFTGGGGVGASSKELVLAPRQPPSDSYIEDLKRQNALVQQQLALAQQALRQRGVVIPENSLVVADAHQPPPFPPHRPTPAFLAHSDDEDSDLLKAVRSLGLAEDAFDEPRSTRRTARTRRLLHGVGGDGDDSRPSTSSSTIVPARILRPQTSGSDVFIDEEEDEVLSVLQRLNLGLPRGVERDVAAGRFAIHGNSRHKRLVSEHRDRDAAPAHGRVPSLLTLASSSTPSSSSALTVSVSGPTGVPGLTAKSSLLSHNASINFDLSSSAIGSFYTKRPPTAGGGNNNPLERSMAAHSKFVFEEEDVEKLFMPSANAPNGTSRPVTGARVPSLSLAARARELMEGTNNNGSHRKGDGDAGNGSASVRVGRGSGGATSAAAATAGGRGSGSGGGVGDTTDAVDSHNNIDTMDATNSVSARSTRSARSRSPSTSTVVSARGIASMSMGMDSYVAAQKQQILDEEAAAAAADATDGGAAANGDLGTDDGAEFSRLHSHDHSAPSGPVTSRSNRHSDELIAGGEAATSGETAAESLANTEERGAGSQSSRKQQTTNEKSQAGDSTARSQTGIGGLILAVSDENGEALDPYGYDMQATQPGPSNIISSMVDTGPAPAEPARSPSPPPPIASASPSMHRLRHDDDGLASSDSPSAQAAKPDSSSRPATGEHDRDHGHGRDRQKLDMSQSEDAFSVQFAVVAESTTDTKDAKEQEREMKTDRSYDHNDDRPIGGLGARVSGPLFEPCPSNDFMPHSPHPPHTRSSQPSSRTASRAGGKRSTRPLTTPKFHDPTLSTSSRPNTRPEPSITFRATKGGGGGLRQLDPKKRTLTNIPYETTASSSSSRPSSRLGTGPSSTSTMTTRRSKELQAAGSQAIGLSGNYYKKK